MKLKFDSELEHQRDAVSAAVGVFKGMSATNDDLSSIVQSFDTELFNRLLYKDILPYRAEEVHSGYFSQDKKGLKDTSGSTAADEDTYHLIITHKEKLLDQEEPLRFIFSHSALKEGWDNPNVFQICTLRDIGTDTERRQTIGRGLRLPVNQQGGRIFDETINRLQRETELTRSTLCEILLRSDRLEEFSINPQAFMTEVAKRLNETLQGSQCGFHRVHQFEGSF